MMAGVLSGVVAATSGPAVPFFVSQPTVSPASGTAGQTFTATPGTVANGLVTAREWRLAGTVVSTTLNSGSTTAGALTYQEFAGAVASNLVAVTVSAGTFFGSNTQTWGDNTTFVFGKAA
ncbi:MAG: hypothetical protein M3Y22_07050 [Pseudomonadota bacterium]|nr:hypothetical protein [Pseudomonadota bacterium]